ncbi:MAG: hypothetical protein ACI8UO_001129 [Verrucomicrobiales bacterium]|jgi:uncharacterized protein (DUF58 family)
MNPEPDRDISEILKKVRRIELKSRGLVRDGIAGEYHSCFKGQGIDFEDFRAYNHGDEVRSIDWNVTARMGTPFIKNFAEQRELTVFILVDVSASGNFGSVDTSKRELAAEVAAVMAFSALQNKDKVGLILFSDKVELCLPPKKGTGHVLRVIREILFHRPQRASSDPAPALKMLSNVARKRCLAFLVSDFLFKLSDKTVATASAMHDLVAAQVSDPAEIELPNAGMVLIEDPETGRNFQVNTGNAGLREDYRKERASWQAELDTFFRRHAIDLIQLETDKDYMPALHGFFKRRERVQI